MPPDFMGERALFSQRVYPNRSLSQKNFQLLMLLMVVANLALGIPFFLLGAWPVVGFMGLDVALVWLAFRLSYRSARAYEDVTLTPLELKLAKVSSRGARQEWRFNPSWVRLEQEDDAEFGLQKLDIVSRGRKVAVGSFLGPHQKAEFALGLSKALAEARRGTRYS